MLKGNLSAGTLAILATILFCQAGFCQGVDSRALLKQLDQNGDGVVTPDEVPDRKQQGFNRLLRIGDKNKDKKLTRDEITGALTNRGRERSRAAGKAATRGGGFPSRGGQHPDAGSRPGQRGAGGAGSVAPEAILTRFDTITLQERLLHVAEAERTLGTNITWLIDSMSNEIKHTLGDAANSEFIIDPDGKVAASRSWSNPDELRKDLTRLVGAVSDQSAATDCSLLCLQRQGRLVRTGDTAVCHFSGTRPRWRYCSASEWQTPARRSGVDVQPKGRQRRWKAQQGRTARSVLAMMLAPCVHGVSFL